MQLVAIQMTSGADIDANLAYVASQLARVNTAIEPTLILLPENFALFSNRDDYVAHAEPLGQGRVQQQLADWAIKYQCWLVAGSFPILSDIEERIYTTSLAFDPTGELVQHYHKIHLFDAHVPAVSIVSNAEQGKAECLKELKKELKPQTYKESDSFIAGEQIATFTIPANTVGDSCVDNSAVGERGSGDITVGMAICYDLRFPELFRALSAANADVLLLPAAFTHATGQAHWLPLLQARAIENQCYVLAANQVGDHGGNRHTWGHSVILDPWGESLAQQTSSCGICCARLDKHKLVQVRADIPILQHARFTASLKNKE
ncbi:carbon-nitrogen hydrolase family protein [Moritella marina ATCC 15381]|uniref:Carbon-nitrogen hydrolase family protein n=1 Tax=Moritella marina ATCC 15381 TaxID=1202962 RepID=A0A5J6WNL5_MORMI|nr:carbon-nitrogen hydrolase family protein [Moritella marina]QFI39749.1 carbon-nitrogen hydrolase family protein [Moritella marina ATCC 15381]